MQFGWNPCIELEGKMHSIIKDAFWLRRHHSDFTILEFSIDYHVAARLDKVFNPDVRRALKNFITENDFQLFLHVLYSGKGIRPGNEDYLDEANWIAEFFSFAEPSLIILHSGRRARREIDEFLDYVRDALKSIPFGAAVEVGRKGFFPASFEELEVFASRVPVVLNTSLLWAMAEFSEEKLEAGLAEARNWMVESIHWGGSKRRGGDKRELHNLPLSTPGFPLERFASLLKCENNVLEIVGANVTKINEELRALKAALGF
jgi:hypothetical protein